MENMTKKFADAVLTRRKQLGLTQEELAARVGTSKQMVCKYEKGQRSPKVAMANAFASALETTLDELLDVEKVEEEIVIPQTEEARFVSIAMDKMPKEERKKAVNVLKAMYGDFFNEAEDKIG